MQGDARQALPYLRQALAVANESNLQADAALWAGNLAAANVELGEWDEAERFNDEAKRLKTATRTGNLVSQHAERRSDRAGARPARRRHPPVRRGAGRSRIRSERALDSPRGPRGVAVARSKPDEASRHFEAALDTIEKTRSELLKTEYKLSFLTRLIQFYQAYVDALVDQGRIERALEVSDSSRGRVLGERNGLAPPAKASAAALRQVAARSRSVLLSYWLGPTRSYVWVVTAAGVQCLRLPPANEIADAGTAVPGHDQQRSGRSARIVRHGGRSSVSTACRAGVAVGPAGHARRHRRRWRAARDQLRDAARSGRETPLLD